MAPVVAALRSGGIHASILATAQHRELLDQILRTFGLSCDWDLDAMRPNQSLSGLVGRILPEMEELIRRHKADLVLAQGDTTTVFSAALAAFHAQVPFAHVEAGLRSGDLQAPFPEEANRRLVSVLSRFHFAPSETARQALLLEGVPDGSIHVVGNSGIDALMNTSRRTDLPWPSDLPPIPDGHRMVLVTLHRRENFGDPLRRILLSLRDFANSHPETHLVYPVHPNPNVFGPAKACLAGLPNVHLLQPMEYPVLVRLLKESFAVFTDSGGLQEEGPALGKPVLVFREVTERPEAVAAGGAMLVGSDPDVFRQVALPLWENPDHYTKVAMPRFPYGRGDASERITSVLKSFFGLP